MAVCPYLFLEEQGTSPFPFASVSHRCYVTGSGLPIGQREQRTYCLVKHYTLCPFFPVQERAAIELDTIPESVVPEIAETLAIGPDTIPEPPPEIAETLAIEPDTIPEPPPEIEATPATETLPERPTLPEAVPEAPTSADGEAPPPEVSVQPVAEPVAARELELAAMEEEPSIGIGPEDAAPVRTHPTVKEVRLEPIARRPLPRPPRRAFIWAAVAGLCTVLLSVAALTIYGLAQLTTAVLPFFDSADLLPAALLILSVSSFAVAMILAPLLLWARRRSA